MLGPEHVFRKADGSNNNLFLPSLGASGSPYARTVPPLHPKPTNLPDPGLIFDCLLKRDNFVEQPSGVSSMMFAFAVLIVREYRPHQFCALTFCETPPSGRIC